MFKGRAPVARDTFAGQQRQSEDAQLTAGRGQVHAIQDQGGPGGPEPCGTGSRGGDAAPPPST